MTAAPTEEHITTLELTEEEHEVLSDRAESVGLDLEIYAKVLMLHAGELPEPAVFFALSSRLESFAKEYKALLQSYAARSPEALERGHALAPVFAALLHDWDQQYGPRP